MTKKNRGRDVIKLMKDALRAGISFEGHYQIRGWALDHGVKNHEVYRLGDWMRQARYELAAEENIAATNPTAGNRYLITPYPAYAPRKASRQQLYKDIHTRAENLATLAQADAAQSDASRWEVELAVKAKIVESLLKELVSA